MLIVASTSTCDVCLEPFGPPDSPNALHIIKCNHLFCGVCILNLLPPQLPPPHAPRPGSCPLCRDLFFREDARRLFVGVPEDTMGSSPSQQSQSLATKPQSTLAASTRHQHNDDPTAQHIMDAMRDIVRNGSDEDNVKAVIAEASAFLKGKNKDQFLDIHIASSFLRYCSDTRVKNIDLEKTKGRLKHSVHVAESAKSAMEKRLQDLNFEMQMERSVARATEGSFRKHLDVLRHQYDDISFKYSHVVGEWFKLFDLYRALNDGDNTRVDDILRNVSFHEFEPEDLTVTQAVPEDIDNAAEIPPPSATYQTPAYFISPLPAFTNVLPPIRLPGDDVEVEDEVVPRPINLAEAYRSLPVSISTAAASSVDDYPRSPGSHLASWGSARTSPSSESAEELLHSTATLRSTHEDAGNYNFMPATTTGPRPGGLSLTAPRDVAPTPSPYPSQSQSRYRSHPHSNPPSGDSPPPALYATARPGDFLAPSHPETIHGRHPTHEYSESARIPTRSSTVRAASSADRLDNDRHTTAAPISRLQELLHDPSQYSPLNSSLHGGLPQGRDQFTPSPSGSGGGSPPTALYTSSTSSSPQSTSSKPSSGKLRNGTPHPSATAPKSQPAPPSVSPTVVVSRASDAAAAQERARRDREREREQRRQVEAVAPPVSSSNQYSPSAHSIPNPSAAIPVQDRRNHTSSQQHSGSFTSTSAQFGSMAARTPPSEHQHTRSSSKRGKGDRDRGERESQERPAAASAYHHHGQSSRSIAPLGQASSSHSSSSSQGHNTAQRGWGAIGATSASSGAIYATASSTGSGTTRDVYSQSSQHSRSRASHLGNVQPQYNAPLLA